MVGARSRDRRAREGAYLSDDLLQEAGDSLMMKLGEAANRLAKRGVDSPEGVEWAVAVANRNFIIHRYDEISRELTWQTLAVDLPGWAGLLSGSFALAEGTLQSRIQPRSPPGVRSSGPRDRREEVRP